jgi:hypothetical protein
MYNTPKPEEEETVTTMAPPAVRELKLTAFPLRHPQPVDQWLLDEDPAWPSPDEAGRLYEGIERRLGAALELAQETYPRVRVFLFVSGIVRATLVMVDAARRRLRPGLDSLAVVEWDNRSKSYTATLYWDEAFGGLKPVPLNKRRTFLPSGVTAA